MKSNKMTALILFTIFALIGGFYLTLSQVSDLQQIVRNLEMDMGLLSEKEGFQSTVTPGKEATSTKEETTKPEEGDTIIPTAILFEVQSSPLLSPQTKITVAMEKMVKEKETGIIRIYLKAYTNKADSYSALEPANFFEILNPSGQNQKPLKVRGQFDSIPPQSSVTGEVIFKITPEEESIILQIESDEDKKYYEFDFEEKSYEEATMG